MKGADLTMTSSDNNCPVEGGKQADPAYICQLSLQKIYIGLSLQKN